MDDQRYRQCRGHGGRGRRRSALLGLAILTLQGCGGEGRIPTSLGGDRPIGGGQSGGATVASALVGTWRNVWVVFLDTDVQTWTTVWTFRSDNTCVIDKTLRSLALEFPQVTIRPCRYTIRGTDLGITWTDAAGGVATLPFSFAGFSPDRLVLEGLEYERLP